MQAPCKHIRIPLGGDVCTIPIIQMKDNQWGELKIRGVSCGIVLCIKGVFVCVETNHIFKLAGGFRRWKYRHYYVNVFPEGTEMVLEVLSNVATAALSTE